MNIEYEYTDLAGARNHARAEGYRTPTANKHDALAAAPLVITAEVVLKALRGGGFGLMTVKTIVTIAAVIAIMWALRNVGAPMLKPTGKR